MFIFHRDYSVIFQCAVWDKLKLLDKMDKRQRNTLKQVICRMLIAGNITPINCFKVDNVLIDIAKVLKHYCTILKIFI